MRRWGRIAIGLFIVLIMTAIAILILSLYLVRSSLPKTSGTIKLQGLRSIAKIYRDNFGIPHIFANNEDDLFFAMGFVTAQDRLWQMDISRRIANGTLSEIFGEKAVESDRFFRTIGLERTAEKIIQQLSLESQNMLTKYTAGINTFIMTNKDKLPLEFTLLNYKPQLWKVEDSIAYQRLIAWSLSLGQYYDLIFGALIEKLGYNKVKEIFPEYLTSDPVIISPLSIKFSDLYDQFHQIFNQIADWIPSYSSSNSWVISGKKSNTGKPLLANDPHLKLTQPSIFYEIHLVAPFIHVYGVSIPGVPGVVIGHNPAIAWGLTNMMVDDVDFFIEKVDTSQYFYQNKWHELNAVMEIIQIKDQQPETLVVRSTNHGPIVSDIFPTLKNSNQGISMRWTGHDISDESFAYYQLMKASNWNQCIEALKYFKVPGQNIIYADTSGNIGYWGAANIPIRNVGYGEFPYPGWNNMYEWKGYVPFYELPHLFNPAQQFIITANNKVIGDNYPYFISNYWEPPYRAARIHDLLSQNEQCTVEYIKQMQSDWYSKQAEFILPLILKALSDVEIANDLSYYFYDTLKNWDFTVSPEQVAPSIFNVFFSHFINNIFKDEMGDSLFNQFIHLPSLVNRATDQLIHKVQSQWFDDSNTPELEDMNTILLKSLDDALNDLIQKHGKLIDDWRWGKLHKISFLHQLGEQRYLNVLFNIGTFPLGGDNSTINLGGYRFSDSFATIIGPATRQIVDLADINNSLSVIPTGESGQPLDKHYKDQINLWLDGNYHQAIMSIKEIEDSKFDLMILKPK